MGQSSLLSRLRNPVLQASVVLAAVVVFNLVVLLLSAAGAEIETRYPWTIACTFVLFYAIFNTIISLSVENAERYWTRSILSYIGLVMGGGLLARAFSSLTMSEAGTYKWIYTVITFGYLLFLVIIRLLRKIVAFAEREEWNHPRLQKKKKKRF